MFGRKKNSGADKNSGESRSGKMSPLEGPLFLGVATWYELLSPGFSLKTETLKPPFRLT